MEADGAVRRGFAVLARPDAAALQHRLDPPVEALDHAAGPGRCGRGQAVFDAQLGAELVERGRARRGAPAQAEQAVGERLAAIGQDDADADRAGAFEVTEAAPSWRHRPKPDGAGRALA
jgi:hypothetical protein